jgi:hypothetical protein
VSTGILFIDTDIGKGFQRLPYAAVAGKLVLLTSEVFPMKRIYLVIMIVAFMPLSSHAEMDVNKALSHGETVYVSIYSHVLAGPKAKPFPLSSMLVVRNTDPKNEISFLLADYYDTDGKLLERYLKNPIILKPLASTYLYIKEKDLRGGPGANFLVRWHSEKWVNQPIIEGVMLGLSSSQGVSFICPGQILMEGKN